MVTPTGSKVYLNRDAELQDIALRLYCEGPTGDTTEVTGDILDVGDAAGPYTIIFKCPFSGNRIEQTVVVDPVLDGNLSLDNICMQSHIMKCCGPLEDWQNVFKVSKDSGYNMVHLTPVQALGISNSSYSLHSHLSLSPTLCLPQVSYEEQLELFYRELRKIQAEDGLLFLTDVVWNHVSICNEDIRCHGDAYYNLENTPNLIPAYLLDRELGVFEEELKSGEHPSFVSISTGHDVNLVVQLLKKHLETARVVKLVDAFLPPGISYPSLLEKVLGAIRGGLMYRFVDGSGLRYSFPEKCLVERYFKVPGLTLAEETQLDVNNVDDGRQVLTCNGWTMGESIDDMSTTQAYLKREVVIWGDSIKLRYGQCPSDSPWLWRYMERYTCDMARGFHGFRIDNCHNTPLHVGEYFLRKARGVRSNLYVVAELFTGDEAVDKRYINRMGLNSCIRELLNAESPLRLGEQVYYYGESRPCGSFSTHEVVTNSDEDVMTLLPSRPHAMLTDQTHDNPCPFDLHPVPNILAMSAMLASAKCSIGSNRGYDELVPHHINVVTETRQYKKKEDYSETGTSFGDLKKALLDTHQMLEHEGYSETFVDQARDDLIIVTRHNPHTCGKALIAIRTDWHFHTTNKEPCDHSVSLPGMRITNH